MDRDEDRDKLAGVGGDTVRKGGIIRPTRLTTIAGPLCFRQAKKGKDGIGQDKMEQDKIG